MHGDNIKSVYYLKMHGNNMKRDTIWSCMEIIKKSILTIDAWK